MAHQHISTPTLDIAYETGGPAHGSPVLLVAMSTAWTPGPFATPALEQARRYWYQWFMATERGAAVVREQGVAFARFQWDTWSRPAGVGHFPHAKHRPSWRRRCATFCHNRAHPPVSSSKSWSR